MSGTHQMIRVRGMKPRCKRQGDKFVRTVALMAHTSIPAIRVCRYRVNEPNFSSFSLHTWFYLNKSFLLIITKILFIAIILKLTVNTR